MGINDNQIGLLADKPASQCKEELYLAGQLISAAREGNLAVILGRHKESHQEGAIICSVQPVDGNDEHAQYVPLAMLSTMVNPIWPDYDPPECALPDTEVAAPVEELDD